MLKLMCCTVSCDTADTRESFDTVETVRMAGQLE
jgi:hypothetical protein